ncbi:hypothetical protein OV090_37995 [Nannocystis sp. RBIL2]|uniref:outer membrane protein assembly factor BamB family protein n=1 Tax=Nannocystis sp. RBIL2 TaxID=2996788 RepID=UPI0022718AED|nr:PQQ-binding-like beta-propeller repeat protein [Nannocystis sp. RBIL2]MCY1070596.1 hypothetical protein [Nannocystis sp. RBIL2]
MRTISLLLALVPSTACIPDVLEQTTDGSTTAGEPNTGGPPGTDGTDGTSGTAGPDVPTSGTGDPALPSTSGEPGQCPEGQPWSLLGSTDLAVPDDFFASTHRDVLTILPDGRAAIGGTLGTAQEGGPVAPAVLFASASGEVLTLAAGEPATNFGLGEMVVAADGGLVAPALRVDGMTARPGLLRVAADGSQLTEVELAVPVASDALALFGDTAVLAGLDRSAMKMVVAKVVVATGALVWRTELGDAGQLLLDELVPTPEGDVVVAGRSGDDISNPTNHELWRIGAGGGLVWHSPQAVPAYTYTPALALLPNGQVAALRLGTDDGRLDLVARDLADGSLQWEVEVAAAEPPARLSGRFIHVDADALSIPVLDAAADELSLGATSVQRVSFDGQLLESLPLAVPPGLLPYWGVLSARGACGELVVVAGERQNVWFGTFAQ